MAKTLRVHSLAKELGVSSKDLIAKCGAEGIELKNHMAAITAGLAESIREWFSVDADVTSVEVASPVDLQKVRKKPKVKIKPKEQIETVEQMLAPAAQTAAPAAAVESEVGGAGEAVPAEGPAIAVAEAPAIAASAADSTESSDSAGAHPIVLEPAATLGSETAALPVVEEGLAAAASEVDSVGEQEAAEADQAERVVSKSPPEPVVPAGPQLVPKPAELKGPRVVRIESPETDTLRSPRVPRPPRRDRPAAQLSTAIRPPPAADPPTETARRGRSRGTPGRGPATDATRARSPRRRGADLDLVGERLREWRDQDLIERKERLASATGHGLRDRRAAEKRRSTSSPGGALPAERSSMVEIQEPILLKSFCSAVGVPFTWVMKKMLEHGGAAPRNINEAIDAETAEMLALELGVTLQILKARTAMQLLEEEFAAVERRNLQPRPPVVAMLGHVDHGKTSLLDRIRKSDVAAGEAGGITQHIGAYRIDRGDWHVTFLDTPGHEAFTAMRARGANLTDVVVLVVAADDGVMPQTVEAINHAKAAGVQIVIALNKIDLPGVDLNRIYAQLAEHDLAPAEWGGHTDVIKTSATTGEGIDELIEHLSTLSEVMDLTADPTVATVATVIEADMREGRGFVAEVLVREGTLERGQVIVCGPGAGRVRTLRDDKGRDVAKALPGSPVAVSGLDELPQAGDDLFALKNLKRAKDIATETRDARRAAALHTPQKAASLEDLLRAGDESQVPELAVIIKADGQGSVDALRDKLLAFPSDKARLNLLHAGVGAISEADVALAQASGALIIGFHVVAEDRARQLAERGGVEIRQYRIIYEITDDVHKALEGLLEPLRHQEPRGSVEVRRIFNVSRLGTVAGCYVSDGVVQRNHRVRLVRDGRIVLEDAAIASLKRFKDDAREVRSGFECGLKIAGFDDVKPGDVIEAFEVVEVAQRL